MGIFRALYWEIKMDVKSSMRYRFGIISDIVVYSVLLSFFLISDSGQSYADTYGYSNYKELLVMGYLAWLYATTSITSISQIVLGELKQGTFYKKYNAKYSLQILLFGRIIAALLIQTIIVFVLIIVSRVVGNVTIAIRPITLVFIIISTLGMYGIGMVIAGLAIFYKRTGAILYIIQLGLLFVTDTIPTLEGITSITRILPLTSCNMLIRKAIIKQDYSEEFVWLLFTSILFIIIGYLFFNIYLKKARKRGNLLFY